MATAFLGPRGTFSEEAARSFAGTEADLVAFTSFPALVSAVETGLAEAAVLPIENSIEGAVSTTLDLLIHETKLKIAAEAVVQVRHFLVTTDDGSLGSIRQVASHPQALGQCRRFLERCLPDVEQVASLSTAGAIEEIAVAGDQTRAAIGPLRAVELYGGKILAHDIQDNRANVTRFVVLMLEDAAPTGDDKTSIGFTLKSNVAGALYRVLGELADEHLQMTKIESRPTKSWLGEYVFLIDLEGHATEPAVARALDRIRESCDMMKVFGSYPRYQLESLADALDPPQRYARR
ncbi:MAG: prephenate dehydratase [Chloroflexota bacterium]|nr:prephenate dehydratase [Chloroflexota bacterium]